LIDTLINIIDRVITLIRERQAHDRRFFQDHVEPLYSDLTLIHTDYLKGLKDISVKLQHIINTKEDWEADATLLVSEHADELAPIRAKVKALIKTVHTENSDTPKSTTDHFFYACAKYFLVSAKYEYFGKSKKDIAQYTQFLNGHITQYLENRMSAYSRVKYKLLCQKIREFYREQNSDTCKTASYEDGREFVTFIQSILYELDSRWEAICTVYATLKKECLR